MQRVYLVQHGQAKREEEDPERPLTDQGADEVARVARHAVERGGVRVARVLHSGKTRARQTAEVWAGLVGVSAEQVDGLAPNDDPSVWSALLEEEAGDVMLVGHLPHLSRLAALLITGSPDRPVVMFRPGGLMGAECAETGWVIRLVLPPEST